MSFDSMVLRSATSDLQRRGLGRDGHRFGQRAGLEREVQRQRARGVQGHVLAQGLLEPLELGADGVFTGSQVRERVEPRPVADDGRLNLGLIIRRRPQWLRAPRRPEHP